MKVDDLAHADFRKHSREFKAGSVRLASHEPVEPVEPVRVRRPSAKQRDTLRALVFAGVR